MKCGIIFNDKKTKNGSPAQINGPLTVVQGELWHGGNGNRSIATFKRLYEKVKHLTSCIFYTDNWEAFKSVLPSERHVAGKSHTVAIERDNSSTRHHLGRFTRRTKVVSKSEEMVHLSLKLWVALGTPEIFKQYQEVALSIFKGNGLCVFSSAKKFSHPPPTPFKTCLRLIS